MNLHDIIQKPLITEKSSIGRDELNLATFAVDPRANKQEIKQAVETMFDVKVIGVRTMQQQGKKRRVGRVVGRRPKWKKAIVQLAIGQSIEFFEGV
jgi:large subunit ribosomal protein L23